MATKSQFTCSIILAKSLWKPCPLSRKKNKTTFPVYDKIVNCESAPPSCKYSPARPPWASREHCSSSRFLSGTLPLEPGAGYSDLTYTSAAKQRTKDGRRKQETSVSTFPTLNYYSSFFFSYSLFSTTLTFF